MLIEVVHARWGMGETLLDGGRNEVAVTPANAPLLAGAAAADAIRVVEATTEERALLDGLVQAQEEGEAEYEQAVADGRWADGQAVQVAVEDADRAAADEKEES